MDENNFRKWQSWAAIATIVTCFFTLIGVILAFISLNNDIESVQNDVARLEDLTKRNQFIITDPKNGAILEMTDIIKGTTPYVTKNHYIIVTPLKTGDDWVQKDILKISPTGLWSGRAIFGTASIGIGEDFIVRIIASNSTLPPGPLTQIPTDSIISEAIKISRRR